jgi:hypothetical protein
MNDEVFIKSQDKMVSENIFCFLKELAKSIKEMSVKEKLGLIFWVIIYLLIAWKILTFKV